MHSEFVSISIHIRMSKEFSFVLQVQDIFMHHWGKYFRAIVDFADGTKHMSKELKHTQREDDLPAKGKLTAKNVTCAPRTVALSI